MEKPKQVNSEKYEAINSLNYLYKYELYLQEFRTFHISKLFVDNNCLYTILISVRKDKNANIFLTEFKLKSGISINL